MLTLNDGRNELWQWDTGRKLTVDADCSQVHFSNKVFGRSIDVDVVDGVAVIPDILLQTDKDLNVWAFVGTAENGYTKISKTFKVNRRNKPADYVFTPPDQTSLEEIKEKIEYLESIQDPDAIKNAVDDYLANNPIMVKETDPTVPEWAKQPTPPDVKIPDKLPNPHSITFTGAVDASYDGSNPVEIKIPYSGGNADQSVDYFLMKSPNGTVYKVVVTDEGVIQVVGVEDNPPENLPVERLLVWNEDFTGAIEDYWTFRDYGGVSSTADIVTITDGVLDIKTVYDSDVGAWRKTSMHTNGKFEFKYGRLEAKMKFGKGCRAAFWTLGQIMTQYHQRFEGFSWPYCGEIDIMEHDGGNLVSQAVHWGPGETQSDHLSQVLGGHDVGDITEWHIYAVEWTAKKLTFYVDDVEVNTFNTTAIQYADGFQPFHEPHYVLLNLFGTADADKTTGHHCYVDWVRYYAPSDVTAEIDIASVALGETSVALNAGHTREIGVMILPDNATDYTMRFESSDDSVAWFGGGGRIQVKGNGDCTLTATAKNGVSASCALHVGEDVVNLADGISLDYGAKNSYYVGETLVITATVTPKWATKQECNWESSNDAVATVTNGVVAFVGGGNVTITATAQDGSGISQSVELVSIEEITDNINTDGCVAKYTRTGWGGEQWVSDVDGDAIAAAYSQGNGYTFTSWQDRAQSYAHVPIDTSGDYTIAERVFGQMGHAKKNGYIWTIMEGSAIPSGSAMSPSSIYHNLYDLKTNLVAVNGDGQKPISTTFSFWDDKVVDNVLSEDCVSNIVFTHKADGTWAFYNNGALVNSGTDSYTMSKFENPLLSIGAYPGRPRQYGTFFYQALLAYDKALTTDEVAALNNALDEMYA